MRKLLVIDLDGTLADTRADLANAVNFMRAKFSLIPLAQDFIISKVGDGISALIARTTPEVENQSLAVREMKEYYSRHLLDETALYPGAKDTLVALKSRGVTVALFSNKPQSACREILSGLGVAELFDFILGGEADFPLKPDPAALNYLQQTTRISLENCFMFGDNHTDLAAARRADFRSIFAAFGFGKKATEAADFTVDSFDKILPIVGGDGQ